MTAGGGDAVAERYERIERIATGGMGEVWRARDTVLGREVAVKVLKREYADDATFRARFEAEARHAAGLHHPGIASVFDFGTLEEGQTPYLVMELVDGRPLSELVGEGHPLDPEQARLLALQVAEALAVAHAAGVVHRDVKPGNLLVLPDGRVKITDFGIARAAGSVAMTQTGQIVGTPHYISPEQAHGHSATAASDVYALGVVLFECLSGHRPFEADTPITTALAHIQQDVPPLPEQVPAALAEVVTRCMAKDPGDRYPDGGALAAALRAAGGDQTQVMGAAAAAPTMVGSPPVSPPTPTPESTPVPEESPRRSRWPLLAALLVLLVVVGALLVARPWAQDSAGEDASADTVTVRRGDYLGKPVGEVRDALRDLGLETETEREPNPGDERPGTVADLDPTGTVEEGTTITLQVWGARPAPESDAPSDPQTTEPSEEPTETDTPEEPTRSAEPETPTQTPETPTQTPTQDDTATEPGSGTGDGATQNGSGGTGAGTSEETGTSGRAGGSGGSRPGSGTTSGAGTDTKTGTKTGAGEKTGG